MVAPYNAVYITAQVALRWPRSRYARHIERLKINIHDLGWSFRYFGVPTNIMIGPMLDFHGYLLEPPTG
jgi:hypothetical protein